MSERVSTAVLLAEIRALSAKVDDRHSETLRYREDRNKKDEVIHRRIDNSNMEIKKLTETVNQGRGAVALFLKIGTISTSIAALGSAAWVFLTKQN